MQQIIRFFRSGLNKTNYFCGILAYQFSCLSGNNSSFIDFIVPPDNESLYFCQTKNLSNTTGHSS